MSIDIARLTTVLQAQADALPDDAPIEDAAMLAAAIDRTQDKIAAAEVRRAGDEEAARIQALSEEKETAIRNAETEEETALRDAGKDERERIASVAESKTALPRSGGALTGLLTVSGLAATVKDHGTQRKANATVTLDVSAAIVHRLTIAANTRLDLANRPAGAWSVELALVNGGAAVIAWPDARWLLGDGEASPTFADMGVTLAASGANTAVLWGTGDGPVYGRAA